MYLHAQNYFVWDFFTLKSFFLSLDHIQIWFSFDKRKILKLSVKIFLIKRICSYPNQPLYANLFFSPYMCNILRRFFMEDLSWKNMGRSIPYIFGIFWDVELWREATSYKSPWSLGLFTPPPYMPIKGAFVISFMHVRYQKKNSSYGVAWGIGS